MAKAPKRRWRDTLWKLRQTFWGWGGESTTAFIIWMGVGGHRSKGRYALVIPVFLVLVRNGLPVTRTRLRGPRKVRL